jgi:predicted O-methyltransferase YrrM
MTLQLIDTTIDQRFPSMHGWMSPEKGKRIARLVSEKTDPLCVELGVFGGRGVFAMALAVKYLLKTGARVHGIDPFTASAALEGVNTRENEEWWSKLDYQAILKSARSHIDALGLSVDLILKRSQDVVGDYAAGSIDIIHQDSNHSEEVTCAEVAQWTPKMKPRAYWVFDDVDWPTTNLAQARLQQQHGYELVEHHGSWAIFRAP